MNLIRHQTNVSLSPAAFRRASVTIGAILLLLLLASGALAATWDFNNDGKADILWRNAPSHQIAAWLMDGPTILATGLVGPGAPEWSIIGVADFTGDGQADLLWVRTDGFVSIWPMNGASGLPVVNVGAGAAGLTAAGVGDVNGDGKPDIVWRNGAGEVVIWFMDGATHTSTATLPTVPGPGLTLVQVADFDDDQRADLLWRDGAGQASIWLLDGASILSMTALPTAPVDWTIVGVGDFNGDSKADILWRQTTGMLAVWFMDGATVTATGSFSPVSNDWAVVGVRDFSGDGKADILWRHTTGTVGLWVMDGATPTTMTAPAGAEIAWRVSRVETFHWPTITSPDHVTFNIGAAAEPFFVTTMGFPEPSIARGGAPLPPGVTFTDHGNGTGTLIGPPDLGTVTDYAITFTATNTAGATPAQNFTLTIGKGSQTTSFTSTAPVGAVAGGPTHDVTATATSGLEVTFTIDASATSVCTIAGATVSFTAIGTCVINANQAGDANWNPAPQVQQSFPVGQGVQTITFTSTPPADATVGGPTYNVTADGGGSGNPVTFAIDATAASVCSIAGPVVSFIGGGTCVINANQAGNANFAAAPQMQQSFPVAQPPLITSADSYTAEINTTLTFNVTTTGVPTPTVGQAPVGGQTGFPAGVTFTPSPGGAAIGGSVTSGGAQTYTTTITATNGSPPDATQAFSLIITCPTITVTRSGGGTFPDGTFGVAYPGGQAVTATGGTGHTFTVTGGTFPPGLTLASGGGISGTPTDTGAFTFTVTANTGGCTGSAPFTINVDPNVQNDAYNALGNVLVDSSNGPGTPFTVTSNDSFPSGATISTFQTPSANGGTVTMTTSGANLGRFTYNPPVGFTGADTFTYTVLSNGRSKVGTVTFTMTGKVWFISNAGGACPGAPCNGRMTNPFVDVSNFQTANTGTAPAPTANDAIFVYSTGVSYSGAVTLLNGQRVVGQHAAGTLATLGNVTAQNGQTLPATNNATPVVLGGALTTGSGNFLHGVTLSGSPALTGNNFGTLTVNDNVVINTTGQAINLTNGTLAATLTSVTSSGGTNNVVLSGVATTGTANLGTGTLSGASSISLFIALEAGSFTYGGTISNTAARTVSIQSKTGGSVTLSGDINPVTAGGGILVQNNSTGTNTITFSGSQKKISSGTTAGVSLATNTGATVAFTNGGLTIQTTTGAGFSATGGGTVTVQGTGNTINSGANTALDVTSTAIGGSGLTFQSISANGGGNGIVLSSTGTSGGLTVTGTGSAGTGGTIQNITNRGVSIVTAADISLNWMTFTNAATTNGADPTNHASGCGDLTTGGNLSCNAPIHLANVSKLGADPVAVTLANLTITNSAQVGINVNNVDGLSLTDTTMSGIGNQTREYGIKARNLFGAVTFNTLTISNSFGDHVRIDNNGAQATTLNVTNSAFSTTTEGNGFVFNPNGSATTVVNVASSSFTSNFSTGLILGPTDPGSSGTVTIDVTGGPFTNNNAGIQIFGNGTTDVTYDVHDIANISGNPAAGIQNDMSDQSQSTASLVGKIRSNTITMPASGAGNGIGLTARGAGTSTISVTSNTVTNTSQYGIHLHRKEGLAPGTMNATVTGNNVTTSDTNGDLLFPIDGIRVEAGAASADTGSLCANISGNIANGAGDQPDNSGFDLKLRHRFGIIFNVVSNVADASMTGAEAITVLNAANPAVDTIDATTTTNFVGVTTACPTPP